MARIDTFENEAKSAEYKTQLILEASSKDKEELERITFDLERAGANLVQTTLELAQTTLALEQMR
eukprot:1816184-Heterocapsa_arctica.AAC.1